MVVNDASSRALVIQLGCNLAVQWAAERRRIKGSSVLPWVSVLYNQQAKGYFTGVRKDLRLRCLRMLIGH
jgi:hypothetical protein